MSSSNKYPGFSVCHVYHKSTQMSRQQWHQQWHNTSLCPSVYSCKHVYLLIKEINYWYWRHLKQIIQFLFAQHGSCVWKKSKKERQLYVSALLFQLWHCSCSPLYFLDMHNNPPHNYIAWSLKEHWHKISVLLLASFLSSHMLCVYLVK